MDRESPVSDEGTREENEPEIYGGEERAAEDELEELPADSALDEGALEEADEEAEEDRSEDSERPRRGRRRRRRRRPGDRGPSDRGPHEERAPSSPASPPSRPDAEAADDDLDDDLDEDSEDLTGESELGVDDETEDGEEAPRVYRNVPTWEEAISFLVHKRPEGRSRDDGPGGPREPRRDGGRPR
jgi:hypothetical protein